MVLPSPARPATLNCCVAPGASVTAAGVTWSAASEAPCGPPGPAGDPESHAAAAASRSATAAARRVVLIIPVLPFPGPGACRKRTAETETGRRSPDAWGVG